MSGGEVNKLDLRSVSGGEQQEELGQKREKRLVQKNFGNSRQVGQIRVGN
jgi:hypothetical protein